MHSDDTTDACKILYLPHIFHSHLSNMLQQLTIVGCDVAYTLNTFIRFLELQVIL